MSRKSHLLAAAFVPWVFLSILVGPGPAQTLSPSPRANELIRSRQYADAVKLLLDETKGKVDEQIGRHHLLLGECHYMLRDYEQARPFYVRAARNCPGESEKVIAEYRLACVAFRLKDYPGAAEKIDTFAVRHPADAHVGKLLVYKMLILAPAGKESQKQLESLHARIYADIRKYDYSTGMEADEVLCDFYRQIGQADKAEDHLRRIVQNFNSVIAELVKEKRSIPAGYEKSHDNAALQLGILALERKQSADATRWLENVRYDQESRARARLLLARIAYEKGDYPAAINHVTAKNLLETVPPGPLKSDMYLLLGLCEKARDGGSAAKVEEYLRKVGPESRAYVSAQSALGDIYYEKGLTAEAIKAFENALGSSGHAANALHKLAAIYVSQAEKTADRKQQADLNKKAADLLGQLFVKYPLSPSAKTARPLAEGLTSKGLLNVGLAGGTKELIEGWERTARQKPGSFEAAQALMSLMRFHYKTVFDESAKDRRAKMTKAPDYAACAAVCDRLLDSSNFKGEGFDVSDWNGLKAEVLFHRGSCELASAFPAKEIGGAATPKYLGGASAGRARDLFAAAEKLVDSRNLELVKNIKLAHLEALFKSDAPADKEAAERRFAELEGDYGNDWRFQRLAEDLANWHRQQGRLAEAARQFMGVAERGKALAADEACELYYTAGALYSQAAWEAQRQRGNVAYCINIVPKEAIAIPESVLRSHEPLSRTVQINWPNNGKNITARQAVVAISQASGVPFVWCTSKGPGTIAAYLDEKRLDLKSGKYTAAQALALVLDLSVHRVVYDIGLADSISTIPPPQRLESANDAQAEWKVIEIYDVNQAATRHKPLAARYGSWSSVHPRGSRGGVMLFKVLQHVEEVTRTRIVWANGIDKDAKLAREFDQPPGAANRSDASCAAVLSAVLEPLDLQFKVIARDSADEYYEAAKDCYSKIYQLAPGSRFGERALLALAMDFYRQGDYPRMKEVLKGYLKRFDSSNDFYHEACFWVGWTLENEKKHREACTYYARAAEERLVIVKATTRPARDHLRKSLSYDSQFALAEFVSGALKNATLDDLAKFMLNSHIEVRVDPAARAGVTPINRQVKDVGGFDFLCDVLDEQSLTFVVENVKRDSAEKALYRMALAYSKDNVMDQALENCNLLLSRYPNTSRRRDATRLLVDVYRGVKDYRRLLDTLVRLQNTCDPGTIGQTEKRHLAMEVAGVYFDVADYAKAAEMYASLRASSRDASESVRLADAHARAMLRLGRLADAQVEYARLAKDDPSETGRFVSTLLAFYCTFAQDPGASELDFPLDARQFLQRYESESGTPSTEDAARATWVYYIKGLVDVRKGRTALAAKNLTIAATSPDEMLAGEAAFQLGSLQFRQKDYSAAKQTLEYLLVSTRSAESAVRGTYQLALLLNAMNRPTEAAARLKQLVERYPFSPYADKARAALEGKRP